MALPPMTLGLIDLYAGGTVDEAHEQHDFVELREQAGRARTFDAVRQQVESLARELEGRMDGQTPRGQLRMALRAANRRRGADTEEEEVFTTFVQKSYAIDWSDGQRAYFDRWAMRLIRGQDYFLSFTNRNRFPDQQNIVNKMHEFFIRKWIEYEAMDRKARNLLALAIHYLLGSSDLDGFYYENHEKESNVVLPRLKREVDRALAFVQLVQGVMFTSAPSYCHTEYCDARDSELKKRFVFILADEVLIGADKVRPPFLDWHADVEARHVYAVPPSDVLDSDRIRAVRDEIRDKVIAMVDEAREEIYDGAP